MALSDDGEPEGRNLQLLCPYCNRVKGTQGSLGFRMKMTELRAHNVGTGVMVDEREARSRQGNGNVGTGTWEQGACFGVPFRWFSLLKSEGPCSTTIRQGPRRSRKMSQPARVPPGGLTWGDRRLRKASPVRNGVL